MDRADLWLHEVGYSLVVEGHSGSGIIDALFPRVGTWPLAEFKTDRVKDHSELERLLVEEGNSGQAQRYIAAAEQALGQTPRCVLCLPDFAGQVYLLPPAAD
jgi:ATP-dependent exoDNAse (exonuclease V) beta subunit